MSESDTVKLFRRDELGMEREQTTIRLPVELKQEIQKEAERKGFTLRDLIVFILWKHVAHLTKIQE